MCKPGENTPVLNKPLWGAGKPLPHGAALLTALISSCLPVLVTDWGHLAASAGVARALGGGWQGPFTGDRDPLQLTQTRASPAMGCRTAQTLREKLHPWAMWKTTAQGAAETSDSPGSCSNPSPGCKHNFQPSRFRAGNRHWLCRKAATGTSNPRVPALAQDRIQATDTVLLKGSNK